MSRRKWVMVLVPTIVILGSVVWWWYRPGCFSEQNFDRLEIGMPLEKAEELLGSKAQPGWVIEQGGRPLVTGDSYYRWEDNGWSHRTIFVGVTNGRIVSKYLYEMPLN